MNKKNNRITPFHFSFLQLAIIGSFLLLAFLAGCSLEGDIAAVKRKAGIYTITFNANGATSGRAAAAMTVRANYSVTLPGGEGLHYPGYVFAGWNPDSSGAGSTYPAGAAYSGTRNVTLYAVWVKESRGDDTTHIVDDSNNNNGNNDGDGGDNDNGSGNKDSEQLGSLRGIVAISPNVTVIIGNLLTATYTGNETVSFQWSKDGVAIPGAIGQFYTPDSTGAYTVTVIAQGYASLESAAVTVGSPGKAAGAIVSTPTLQSKTANSITINPVSAPMNGQTVEYTIHTTNAVPATGWQDGLTFSGLNPGTSYYIFARAKENGTNNPGLPSAGLAVTTDAISGNVGSMDITFSGPTERVITITKTDNGGGSITLSVNELFDEYIWYVKGTKQSGATSNTITLLAGTDFTWGDWLTLVVYEGTVPLSGSFPLYLE